MLTGDDLLIPCCPVWKATSGGGVHVFLLFTLLQVAPFSLRVLGGAVGKCYLSPQEDYPLCQLAAER